MFIAVDLMLCVVRFDKNDIKLYVLDTFHLQRAKKHAKLNQSVKIPQDVNKKNIC